MKDAPIPKILRKQQCQSLQDLVLLRKVFVLSSAAPNMMAYFLAMRPLRGHCFWEDHQCAVTIFSAILTMILRFTWSICAMGGMIFTYHPWSYRRSRICGTAGIPFPVLSPDLPPVPHRSRRSNRPRPPAGSCLKRFPCRRVQCAFSMI